MDKFVIQVETIEEKQPVKLKTEKITHFAREKVKWKQTSASCEIMQTV